VSRPVVSRTCLVLLGLLTTLGCATRPPQSQIPSPDAQVVDHVPIREFEDDNCGPGSLAVVLNTLGDPVTATDLLAQLPHAPGGGVLSVDLLLAARQRGFSASLVSASEETLRDEILSGRPVILMLRLLNAPGRGKDIYHYVVVDGVDPRRELFRFQFGDGEVRWTTIERLEGAWKGAGHALLTIRPRESAPDLQAAVELENAGQLDAAEEEYNSIIETHPDSVRAWVNLGNVRSRRGRTVAAEQAYRRALDLAPEDPDALNNLAWLLLEGGTALEEAESLARAATRHAGPDLPLVLDTLGRVLRARGQCSEAEATFREALELPGLSPALQLELEGSRRELREDCPSLP
jgi:hypothetical protein